MRARGPATGIAAAASTTIAIMMLANAGAVASGGLEILACFTPAKQAAISSGRAIVDLAHVQDVDLAIIGAVRTTAGGDRLLAWYREIEQLQTGPNAPAIRRFSDPPQIADLAGLALDDQDLDSLRECRPGRCEIKLSAGEMAAVQRSIRAAGPRWKLAAQNTFRQLILDRARQYLAGGLTAALPYEDHEGALSPGREFESLLQDWRPAVVGMASPAAYMRSHQGRRPLARESLLLWSRDVYDGAKPVFSITHLTLFAGDDADSPTLATAVQVYASHYLTASASLTAIVSAPGSAERYLVYSRRSRADVFRGALGGWIRRIVQKRVGAEGSAALDRLRTRLEAGTPEPRSSR